MHKNNITFDSRDSLIDSKVHKLLIYAPKGSKVFYNNLINKINTQKACTNWENLLNNKIKWSKVFSKTKKIPDIKLKWFQIRINNRILVTNAVLRDMRVVESDMCNFCATEKDTIYHYLWQCEHVRIFWTDLERLLKAKTENCIRLKLTPTLILFGCEDRTKTDEGFDHILLTAKFFIYKCRINKVRPRLQMFLKELKREYIIDKYVHSTTMKREQFVKKMVGI